MCEWTVPVYANAYDGRQEECYKWKLRKVRGCCTCIRTSSREPGYRRRLPLTALASTTAVFNGILTICAVFFANQTPPGEIIYDARKKVYRLIERDTAHLNNSEVLAVCKILLESRSMRRDEMLPILDKLVDCCVPAEQRRAVVDLLANEKHLYMIVFSAIP